jgi:hypothetical protein
MDKEQTKQAIAVMQAYVDGKTIVRGGYVSHDPAWSWNNDLDYYRVKPEPKLRPWTPVEAAAHLDRGIGHSDFSQVAVIKAVCSEGVDLVVDGKLYHRSLRSLAEKARRVADGQPCGVLEPKD